MHIFVTTHRQSVQLGIISPFTQLYHIIIDKTIIQHFFAIKNLLLQTKAGFNDHLVIIAAISAYVAPAGITFVPDLIILSFP